jgi:hypothetical protein
MVTTINIKYRDGLTESEIMELQNLSSGEGIIINNLTKEETKFLKSFQPYLEKNKISVKSLEKWFSSAIEESSIFNWGYLRVTQTLVFKNEKDAALFKLLI